MLFVSVTTTARSLGSHPFKDFSTVEQIMSASSLSAAFGYHQAADLIALVERGDIDGCSFSFIANMDDWKTDATGCGFAP